MEKTDWGAISKAFDSVNSRRDFTKNMVYADVKGIVKPFEIQKSEVIFQAGFQYYF